VTGITQRSIVQIIHPNLGECISFTNTLAGYYC